MLDAGASTKGGKRGIPFGAPPRPKDTFFVRSLFAELKAALDRAAPELAARVDFTLAWADAEDLAFWLMRSDPAGMIAAAHMVDSDALVHEAFFARPVGG